MKADSSSKVAGRVLVVDDDEDTRTIHRLALATQFDVETASSGEQALNICKEHLPDLVLLDVVMPNMDGYEVCRKLRNFTDIPIIFATANESLDEHLKAFDVGGEDLFVKPVTREILLRKVSLAIQRKHSRIQLEAEKDSLRSMAMNFLSAAGETGILQRFMQISLLCNTPEQLGQKLIETIKDFGLECIVLIKDSKHATILTSHGDPSSIEVSILEQSSIMGRIFQFKQRLVVNYDHVSVIVSNLPVEETEKADRLRDDITILAEMTDTLCGNVAMRQSSNSMAEQLHVAMSTAYFETKFLRESSQRVQMDVRLLLHELVDNVEKAYSWLDTNRIQEESISKTMLESVEKILVLLQSASIQSDEKFNKIEAALSGGSDDHEAEIF